tara:strand:+ start:2540 stop:2854 length:315 start_codon:yes stop_codon:yes gene_type:complete
MIATTSVAQKSEPKNLYTVSACATIDTASNSLKEAYGEQPFALGTAYAQVPEFGTVEGVLILTVNPKTRTYTVNIVFEKDDMVCMVLSGTNFKPADPYKPKTSL